MAKAKPIEHCKICGEPILDKFAHPPWAYCDGSCGPADDKLTDEKLKKLLRSLGLAEYTH